jgi:hypothetical protein
MAGNGLDKARQWANVMLAFGQVLVTILCFYTGLSFDAATSTKIPPPPLIPAEYAFIIWAPIYLGCLVYAVYQALPSQRENALLRRIGWYTALAFLGTCCWLVDARFRLFWGTVAFIFWMLGSLYGAFVPLWSRNRQVSLRTRAEEYCVVAPVSVFAGWVSVATFANTASVISDSRWPHFLISETSWSMIAVVLATAFGVTVVLRSRGDAWFTGTLLWAFVAIAMQDFNGDSNPIVGDCALIACLTLVSALIVARWSTHRQPVRT